MLKAKTIYEIGFSRSSIAASTLLVHPTLALPQADERLRTRLLQLPPVPICPPAAAARPRPSRCSSSPRSCWPIRVRVEAIDCILLCTRAGSALVPGPPLVRGPLTRSPPLTPLLRSHTHSRCQVRAFAASEHGRPRGSATSARPGPLFTAAGLGGLAAPARGGSLARRVAVARV